MLSSDRVNSEDMTSLGNWSNWLKFTTQANGVRHTVHY